MTGDREILAGLIALQRGRCAYCGCLMVPIDNGRRPEMPHLIATIDHVHPICLGGKDEHTNRVACCAGCNTLKGGIDVVTFLQLRWNQVAIREAVRRARREISKDMSEARGS